MANRFAAKRRKIWSFIPGVSQSVTADATFGAGGSLGGFTAHTVLRMLGEYVISLNNAAVADDTLAITMAIGVVSTDAVAAGVGSLPDPGAEPDYPWLYWADHVFHFPITGPDMSVQSGSLRHSFDVRSMRKIKPRESLAFIGQYTDLSGTPPVQVITAQTRVLLAMP